MEELPHLSKGRRFCLFSMRKSSSSPAAAMAPATGRSQRAQVLPALLLSQLSSGAVLQG